ncbi:hypothetical protein E4U41_007040 [Claviceps citrina]|nr:hypothetical protein E4U41_007040 [Claviceps citrina]
MDTAEYDTNTLVLVRHWPEHLTNLINKLTVLQNNVSSVSFRVYEPVAEQSPSFGLTAIDAESRLRDQGHIVYYDASRRCIWHFGVQGKDVNGNVSNKAMNQLLGLFDGSLILREEGLFEPSSLQKLRVVVPQAGPTPTTSTSSASVLDQSQRQTPVSPLQKAPQTTPSGLQEQDQTGPGSSIVDSKGTQGERMLFKVIYESFMVATLLTISTAFSKRSGSIPLDYRTVLLPEKALRDANGFGDVGERRPTIGTFKAYMTSTGNLVLSMGFSICRGMLLFDETLGQGSGISGHRILAAPFGMIASNQLPPPLEGGTASMAQTPNTQALSLRGASDMHDSLWGQACLKFLQLRGIARSRLADCLWMNLVVSRPKLQDTKAHPKRTQEASSTVVFPWPGPLCFRKKPVEVFSTSRIGDSLLCGHEECHDPLGIAQAWFSSTSEREEKVSRRKKERAAALYEAIVHDARSSRPNGQSPSTMRRPSTAAAGSMYPTPPDVLQNLNGVTPSLDGTLSSPGNCLSASAVPDAGNNNSNSAAMTGPFESIPDYQDPKRQRGGDSHLLGDPEHMFADMEGDMFGDNDITEADFNFFDEEPGGIDLDAALAGMNDDDVVETSVPLNQDATKEEAPSTTEPRKKDSCREKETMVFTKPELRHTISAQNEIQRGQESRRLPIKREPSPFDPHTVFKKVRASLGPAEKASPTHPDRTRMTKIFAKMDFDPRLPMINKKYEQGGQFDYNKNARPEKPKLDLGSLPMTGYLKRHSKQNRGIKDHGLQSSLLLGSLSGLEAPGSGSSPLKLVDAPMSDGEQSSLDSDQDDSSCLSDHGAVSPVKSSVKHAPLDDDAVSQVTSLKELDALEEPDHQLAPELPRLYKPEASETPLSVLFSDPEPLSLELSMADEDFMQVAQILTEQAATGSLHLCTTAAEVKPSSSMVEQNRQSLLVEARASLQLLREVVSPLLPGAAPVHLKGFLDIQDVPLQGQTTRILPRPVPGRDANAEQKRPSNLYQIPGPHLEVRRCDAKLSVLPSAVTFWESLGLAPWSGSKEITAVCVFPGWKGMTDNAKTFLGRVKSVYEVLRLGSMDNMALSPDMDDGILPYEVDRISTSPDATMTGHGSALVSSMEILRGALSNLGVTDTNVVVYFVYSPGNPGTIVEACAAFQRFSDSYQKELSAKKESMANELVLQLVSADVLSSPTSVVVTPSQQLVKLCMETYDRCTLFGGPMPAPAIRLEQPLPRIIDFKLVTTPSASLIRENSCIHVAYAQAVDERWITAAWTDDRGDQQATASYCLGRKGRPASRSMNEVAHEIWESTLDLISAWKVHWRIIITRCGPMDQGEVEFWIDLARTEIKASVTMILMTVDTNPSLQLIPPVVKLPRASAPFYATPVSTPQANMVSPEQTGTTPATPGGLETGADADTDVILTDVTDQTWGAVVGHRLNNSTSVLDLRPALVSGYLIKRTGPRVEDAPAAMEVNLVHTDANPRSYESLLREMLSYFRGLATLARARGVSARDTDVRPWHIAAAEKAVRAMYLLM